MKATAITVTVANIVHPSRRAEIAVPIDTSRMYGILPGALLRSLGIEPLDTWVVRTSTGSAEEREVADVAILHREFLGPTRVIFGKPGETPVLGSHALDSLGLRLDPETGELKPYPLPLYSCSSGHGFSRAASGAFLVGL